MVAAHWTKGRSFQNDHFRKRKGCIWSCFVVTKPFFDSEPCISEGLSGSRENTGIQNWKTSWKDWLERLEERIYWARQYNSIQLYVCIALYLYTQYFSYCLYASLVESPLFLDGAEVKIEYLDVSGFKRVSRAQQAETMRFPAEVFKHNSLFE